MTSASTVAPGWGGAPGPSRARARSGRAPHGLRPPLVVDGAGDARLDVAGGAPLVLDGAADAGLDVAAGAPLDGAGDAALDRATYAGTSPAARLGARGPRRAPPATRHAAAGPRVDAGEHRVVDAALGTATYAGTSPAARLGARGPRRLPPTRHRGVGPVIAVAVVALCAGACGKAVGAEGGPCTSGGGCDPGLTCASQLCVRLGGEGEGEGCQGDDGGAHAVADCDGIPTAACGPADQNQALTTCKDAGLTLRSGIFDKAFACIAQIPASSCNDLGAPLNACFDDVTACDNADAQSLCQQAADQCASEGDDGFPLSTCVDDLTPTNADFLDAWTACFNAGGACATVESDCYNAATNQLVGGGA